MQPVVTSAEMRACDRYAIEKLNISGLLLMENAGRSVVEMMIKHFGLLKGKSVLIFCGKGNNGGDGFVAARHLLNQGADVKVILTSKPSEIKGDAKTNYESLRLICRGNPYHKSLLIELKSPRLLSMLPKADFIIDALFGTGFSGEVTGNYKKVIDWINSTGAKKVSIDIPSGVNADTGDVSNVAIKADLTVTMGLIKNGLIVGEGSSYSGKIEVADISIPKNVLHKNSHQTFLIKEEDVRSVLPVRPLQAHKYSVGKIFVLAGSKGLTGAAAMTSNSAMRAGAGMVILGTPASVYPILAKKLTEVMVQPLPDTPDGTLSLHAFELVQKHIQWADVLIIGPGLSRNQETVELVRKVVSQTTKKLIIDADGLNALSEKPSLLMKRKSKDVIITPHTGELSRLIGKSSDEIEKDRLSAARETARKFKITVVLKGAPTVTANAKGDVLINSTGNPGMATAGSGDVLAGLIGGLWGQGMKGFESAYSGVYIHGHAGDLAKKEYGEKSLIATDIQEFLPRAITEIERANIS